jgi:hypothetical protein
LLLDESLEPREGIIPLAGDSVEGTAGLVEWLGLELEEILSAAADIADEAGVLEDAKMFGDRLAGEGEAQGEMGDGVAGAGAQLRDEGKACGFAQRGEDGRGFADVRVTGGC